MAPQEAALYGAPHVVVLNKGRHVGPVTGWVIGSSEAVALYRAPQCACTLQGSAVSVQLLVLARMWEGWLPHLKGSVTAQRARAR